jgi:hypothetical protein
MADAISVYDLIPAKPETAPPKTKAGGIPVSELVKSQPAKPESGFHLPRLFDEKGQLSAPDFKVKPALERGFKWVSDTLDETEYGRSVKEAFTSASAQQMEGLEHIKHAQGPLGPVEGWGGVAEMGLGALATLFAPVTALVEQGAVKPTQELTRAAVEKRIEGLTDKERRAGKADELRAQLDALEKTEEFGIQTASQFALGGKAAGKTPVQRVYEGLPPAERQAFLARKANIQVKFDTLAATDPFAATAIADHIEQVDPSTAKYLKNRIQRYVDASDKELSIIGRNAADAAIAELEGDFDKVRPKASGLNVGEGMASPGKGRRSGSAAPLAPVDQPEHGLSTGEGKASPGRGGRSGPATPLIPESKDLLGELNITPEQGSALVRTSAKEGLEALIKQDEPQGFLPMTREQVKDNLARRGTGPVFDPKEGLGAVRINQEIDSLGMTKSVTADKFLKLAAPLSKDAPNLKYVKEHIAAGKPIGNPYLNVAWNEKSRMWNVVGHEGRNRATAIRDLYGGSTSMPVHVIPRGLRASDITDEMRSAPVTAEGKPVDIQSPSDILYFNAGVPITRAQVEAAFKWTKEKIPGVEIAAAKMSRLYEGFIETFNPEAKGAAAKTAGSAIAQSFFREAEAQNRIWEQGKERRKYWQKMGQQAGKDFINQAELGKKFSNPIWENARQSYGNWTRDIVAQDTKTYARSGKELPYSPIDNYVPHVFKDQEGVVRFLERKYKNRWADPGFIKDRSFKLIQEAIDAGFTPESFNPEEVMQKRQFASDVAALRTDLLADLAKKGVAVEATKGAEKPPEGFSPNPRRSPTGVRYWVKNELDPLMYNVFDSKSLWNLQSSAAARGVSAAFRGWMAAKNALIPFKLAWNLFHPVHVTHIDAAAELTRAQELALGNPTGKNLQDLMVKLATGTPTSPIGFGGMAYRAWWDNPKTGWPLLRVFQGKRSFESLSEGDKAAYNDLAESGLVLTRPKEETNNAIQKLKDGWFKKTPLSVFHLPNAVLSGVAYPIYNLWIPSLKGASAIKDFKAWRELNPEGTAQARQEAFRRIAKNVESRYGEMNYQSMFMNKMFKDLGTGVTLSLGWQLGLIDQYAGAGIDVTKLIAGTSKNPVKEGLTSRPLFIANYTATSMAIGGLMTYWLANRKPSSWLDYTNPDSGEKDQYGRQIRLNTPMYTHEGAAIEKHIEQEGLAAGLSKFVIAKGSGLYEMAMAAKTGINSLGDDIRDPEAPAYKQLEQTLAYELSEINSISFKAINLANPQAATKMRALSVAGFAPAGRYINQSAIEGQIADRFNRYVRPQEKSFNAVQMGKDMNDLRQSFRNNDPKYDDKLESAVTKYDLDGKDVRRIQKQFNSPKEFDITVYQFGKLEWAEKKEMLLKMTPDERERFLPHLSKRDKARYDRETE